MLTTLAALILSACSVTDGDTIRCGEERIRLLGIDAPERHRCPRHRRCPPGDPIASASSLRRALAAGSPRVTRTFGRDRYGRLLALVSVGRTDLSCWQLTQRQAIYKPQWDNRRALAAICPAVREPTRSR